MSGNPCLILELSDAGDWPSLYSHLGQRLGLDPLRIPEGRKPAMLQPNRAIAEAEAKRLAAIHPGKRFAVFEAHVVATTVEVPSRWRRCTMMGASHGSATSTASSTTGNGPGGEWMCTPHLSHSETQRGIRCCFSWRT